MRDRGGGGRGRGQDRYRDRYADVREDAAVPEYHDQLDGPVRSAAAAPEQLPDMYSDFPSLSGAPARVPASVAKKDEASEEFPSLGKSSKPQSWSNKSGAAANVEDFPSLPGGSFFIFNVLIYFYPNTLQGPDLSLLLHPPSLTRNRHKIQPTSPSPPNPRRRRRISPVCQCPLPVKELLQPSLQVTNLQL